MNSGWRLENCRNNSVFSESVFRKVDGNRRISTDFPSKGENLSRQTTALEVNLQLEIHTNQN